MSDRPSDSVIASVATLGRISAPRRPKRTDIHWIAVQRRVGSVLPTDYKQFVEWYGVAYLGGFLCTFSPSASNPNVELPCQMGVRLSALSELKRNPGSSMCPYPLWFEPGGLLPWGGTDNGDTLYWKTAALPDAWSVVVGDGRSGSFEEHAMGMTDFLAAFMEGRLSSKEFPPGPYPATIEEVG
jgi:hypothetical protein